jgi:hypothetical protein
VTTWLHRAERRFTTDAVTASTAGYKAGYPLHLMLIIKSVKSIQSGVTVSLSAICTILCAKLRFLATRFAYRSDVGPSRCDQFVTLSEPAASD